MATRLTRVNVENWMVQRVSTARVLVTLGCIQVMLPVDGV